MLLNIEQINLQSMFLWKEMRFFKKKSYRYNTLSVTRLWKRCMYMIVYIRYQARDYVTTKLYHKEDLG